MFAEINWIEGTVLVCLALFIITLVYGYRTIKNVKYKRTEDLESIISRAGNPYLYGPAISELKNRNKDYSIVLPHLIKLSISHKKTERMVGWGLIIEHFPEIKEKIEYNVEKPTEESKEKLRKLLITDS
ncbi:MAG: hypothetical protein ACYST2_03315 [Planctomycetota bacterium]|jgi:hypothetical protein